MASTEREEWSSVVALAATASTVAASAALVGSVLHDWVYFGRLGLRFSEVPTSLVDHARTALLWLPPLGIGMALFSVYELLTRRIEGGKTEDEIVAQSPNPKWAARFRRSGDVGPLVMAAVVIFGGYLLFGGSPFQSELGLGVMALWLLFLRWVYAHSRVRAQSTRIARLAISIGGIFLILTISRGGTDADFAMARMHPTRVIIMKSESRALEVTLFRAFEKGALVRQRHEPYVEFIFWSEIERVKVPYRAGEHVASASARARFRRDAITELPVARPTSYTQYAHPAGECSYSRDASHPAGQSRHKNSATGWARIWA